MKTIHAKKVETPAARAKLKPDAKAYRGPKLDKDLCLQYRRHVAGGDWVPRVYVDGKYISETIAQADDRAPADGITILNFFQGNGRHTHGPQNAEPRPRTKAR